MARVTESSRKLLEMLTSSTMDFLFLERSRYFAFELGAHVAGGVNPVGERDEPQGQPVKCEDDVALQRLPLELRRKLGEHDDHQDEAVGHRNYHQVEGT